jgi:4-hydroxy-tetrahydrodipicolinate synthase
MTRPRFSGIIPPLATPLLELDRLDRDALAALIEHVIAGGVSGIFLLGTTSEGPSLPAMVKEELISEACEIVSGRVPVLVGITDTVFSESVRLAEHAAGCGAQGLVLAPPYYQGLGELELENYLRQVTLAVPLPVLLYNIPGCVKLSISPETVSHLAEMPQVVGLKDSSGDMAYFEAAARGVAKRSDFAMFVGPEEMITKAVSLGAIGGVCAGANLFPRLYVELLKAAIHKETAKADALQQIVHTVSQNIYLLSEAPTRVIRGVKGALATLGIGNGLPSLPIPPLSPAEQSELSRRMAMLRAKFPEWLEPASSLAQR